jgi:hypothetical protein
MMRITLGRSDANVREWDSSRAKEERRNLQVSDIGFSSFATFLGVNSIVI